MAKVPTLTLLEARLLGTAFAGHDLVKAIRQGGNLEEAIREFEDHALAPERIEEYIERPVQVAATELEKMAVRLCKLIGRNDDKNGQKILALARELLAKAEPATVQEVLAEERKRPQGEEARKKMPQSEKTVVPSGQPTNGVERRAQ
jgi:thioredoxin-like negative regulator of GroEL